MTIATNFVDNIGMFVNAAYLNGVGTQINTNTAATPLYGHWSALPTAAAGNSGALYFCDDTDSVYKSNGSAWTKIRVAGAGGTFADPAALTAFNLGTAAFASDKGDRVFTIPSSGSDNLRGEYQTLSPTSGYTVTSPLTLATTISAISVYSGLLLGSSGGAYITFGPAYNPAFSTYCLAVSKWTSATAFSANYTNILSTTLPQMLPRWLRIRDDSTNRICEYSFDNIDWFQAHSVGRTDFLTPDRVGWAGYNTSGATIKLRNRSFAITT